jgi:hypothetical protein
MDKDKKKKPTPLTFPNIFSRTDSRSPDAGRAGDATPPIDAPTESPTAPDPPRLSGRGRSATRVRTTWPAEPAVLRAEGQRAGDAAPADGSPAGQRAAGGSAGNSPHGAGSPLSSPGRFIMEGAILRAEPEEARPPRRPESPDPPAASPLPSPGPKPLDTWMTRTLTQAHQCDTRRDRSGDTPLLRAARAADFLPLVEMLGYPGTDIYIRDRDGRSVYDLLKKSTADHESPEFRVVSAALFLRTQLSLMIREERHAGLVDGAAAGATARQLAEKVYARLAATYHSQPDDRALPFVALPSVDFIEAMIRLM